MAKVTLVIEDVGVEGDARVSYDADPWFDPDGDTTAMTTAQLMAVECVNRLQKIASEGLKDELKNLPPMCERH